MASINQLISEIAHSVQGADSVPVRRAIRLSIIHARNEFIRRSFDQHHITDKVLQQRFRVTLVDVPDGDIDGTANIDIPKIKRTTQKVPRPTRLDNNLPFHSVRTAGVINPIEIPFVKEASAKFYASLPGMCPAITYDYINEYIYVDTHDNDDFKNLGSIVIESVFEKPELVYTETSDKPKDYILDDDEYLLPEDMIEGIKQIVLKDFMAQVVRQTNEVPNPNLVK